MIRRNSFTSCLFFSIQKGIESLAGEPKSIKRLRSGDLLIEVPRGSHSTNLQKATELVGKPIKVTQHRTLNTSKGVIRTPKLRNTTNEEVIVNSGLLEQKRHVFLLIDCTSIDGDGSKTYIYNIL